MRYTILIFLLSLGVWKGNAQIKSSAGSSNWSGILGLDEQPANVVDNRFKFDMWVGGAEILIDNSKVNLLSGKITGTWDSTWRDNFNYDLDGNNGSLTLSAISHLPSFMFNLGQKSGIAFKWSLRTHTNINGLDEEFGSLLFNKLEQENLLNTDLVGVDQRLTSAVWMEYGVNYGQVLLDRDRHYLKGGVNLKLLHGLEALHVNAGYLSIRLDSNKYLEGVAGNVDYAHSEGLDMAILDDPWQKNFALGSLLNPGFDIGLVYEWRPRIDSFRTYINTEEFVDENHRNKYKLKVHASVVDLGVLRFPRSDQAFKFEGTVPLVDITSYSFDGFNQFDEFLNDNMTRLSEDEDLQIALPARVLAGVDYYIGKGFYLGASASIGIPNKSPSAFTVPDHYRLTPRFESRWFDLGIPVTINNDLDLSSGFFLRAGPLVLGSSNIDQLFYDDVKQLDFFAGLRWGIPFKDEADTDGDGVPDNKDECPELAGPKESKGCPTNDPGEDPANISAISDRDLDGVLNIDDKCPDIAGSNLRNGCPDSDADGIYDDEDECPGVPGPVSNNGCPIMDLDGDGVPDEKDDCPEIPGTVEGFGCPTDPDGNFIFPDEDQKILLKAFKNIGFAPTSFRLLESSKPSLDELATLMIIKQHYKLKVSGHTDNQGSEKDNLLLSKRRAEAVKNYLVSKGVSAVRIDIYYYGETRPLYSNETPEGRRKNRRVELEFFR